LSSFSAASMLLGATYFVGSAMIRNLHRAPRPITFHLGLLDAAVISDTLNPSILIAFSARRKLGRDGSRRIVKNFKTLCASTHAHVQERNIRWRKVCEGEKMIKVGITRIFEYGSLAIKDGRVFMASVINPIDFRPRAILTPSRRH